MHCDRCGARRNYPLLCAVNSVVAAVLCGNSVLLKHSDRTPAAADWFEKTFLSAGAPKGLVAAFHADHPLIQQTVKNPAIAYVQFTGSVAGGRAVYKATAESRFIDVVSARRDAFAILPVCVLRLCERRSLLPVPLSFCCLLLGPRARRQGSRLRCS